MRVFKASLTVETALVLPIFLFAVINILYVSNFFYEDAKRIASNTETAKDLAIASYVIENVMDVNILSQLDLPQAVENSVLADDYIDIYSPAKTDAFFMPLTNFSYYTVNRATCRKWIGATDDSRENEDQQGEERIVYVTEQGEKYHLYRNCTYISRKPEMIQKSDISGARNESGAKYYPCDLCDASDSDAYYIVSYGTRYHTDLNCSALKRNVSEVTLEKAKEDGKTLCAKCGEKNGTEQTDP